MKILKNFPRSSIFSLKKPLRYSPPFMVADHSKKKRKEKLQGFCFKPLTPPSPQSLFLLSLLVTFTLSLPWLPSLAPHADATTAPPN